MRLSKRQTEVVRYMAQGLVNKEIANRLGIGPETVKTHRKNAYSKLGVHTPAHCVAVAIREGIIEGDPWEQN